MFDFVSMSGQKRKAVLTLVLFALLVASIAAAWWLVAARRAPLTRGAEIVAELRRTGLKAHWPESIAHWYVGRIEGRPVFWTLRARILRPEGGYAGLDVQHSPAGWSGAAWTLSGQADAGEYLGHARSIEEGLGPRIDNAYVRFGDGNVVIVQKGRVRSQARTPANYAPEGTLGLLIYLAGEHREPAQFRVTYDSEPPIGGKPMFFPVFAAQAEQGAGPGERAVAVRRGGDPDQTDLWVFDREASLVRKELGQVIEQRADREAVLSTFEDVDALVAGFLREVDAKVLPPAARRELLRLAMPDRAEAAANDSADAPGE